MAKIEIKEFEQIINPDTNFDVIKKTIEIGGKEAHIYLIDGFTKDDLMEKIIEAIIQIEKLPDTIEELSNAVPHVEVNVRKTMAEAVRDFLTGTAVMLMDNYEGCLSIDCRTYPSRSVSEPWKNRVLRGSRDGFVETIVANIALMRRRIRTPDFRTEAMSAGDFSKTDIVLAYIDGLADKKLLQSLKERISNIKVDALTMNIESLAETIFPGRFLNPFPKFKYTERPDSAAAAVFDGNIVILVDNSPAVMVVPTTIFDVMEEADDYYFPPITGSYLKISRFLIMVMSLVITPLWVLFLNNPDWVPKWLEFILIEEHQSTVPTILQLLILEFAIDGLRLAAVNTPTLLSTPLSVIAGIVVGEYAVSSGWFDPESMLYMAFVSIGTYSLASFELGYAIKFFRIIILVLTAIFSLWGFIGGLLFFLLALALNKTISGKSYIYPLIPFDYHMLKRKVFRLKLGKEK